MSTDVDWPIAATKGKL